MADGTLVSTSNLSCPACKAGLVALPSAETRRFTCPRCYELLELRGGEGKLRVVERSAPATVSRDSLDIDEGTLLVVERLTAIRDSAKAIEAAAAKLVEQGVESHRWLDRLDTTTSRLFFWLVIVPIAWGVILGIYVALSAAR